MAVSDQANKELACPWGLECSVPVTCETANQTLAAFVACPLPFLAVCCPVLIRVTAPIVS